MADRGPLLSPALLNPPTLTVDSLSFQSGVTNSTIWRAVWHAPIRGIDRRGGILTHTTNGTLLFTSSPANLQGPPGPVPQFKYLQLEFQLNSLARASPAPASLIRRGSSSSRLASSVAISAGSGPV